MSWKASGAAKEITKGVQGEKLRIADKLVLMVLSDDFNEDKKMAWPSQNLLAKRCLCTPRGLRGILERLERFGLIKIVHRGKSGNQYILNFALRNAVPHKTKIYEEPARSSKSEIYEERGAVYEEPARSPELEVEQKKEKPEPQAHPQQDDVDLDPKENNWHSEKIAAETYRNIRNLFKRTVGRSMGSPPKDSIGERFMELVGEFGPEPVYEGAKIWMETDKQFLEKKARWPFGFFMKDAQGWIEDAKIKSPEEKPGSVGYPELKGPAWQE